MSPDMATTDTEGEDEAFDLPVDEEGGAASIHIDNLGKTFDTAEGTEEVFSGVDIDIEPGTFVCLLGKSGSGKSTMLNIVSDVLEPTEGSVRFENPSWEEEVKLGHVFQDPRLLP